MTTRNDMIVEIVVTAVPKGKNHPTAAVLASDRVHRRRCRAIEAKRRRRQRNAKRKNTGAATTTTSTTTTIIEERASAKSTSVTAAKVTSKKIVAEN